jgi:hypothetical protein
MKHDNLLVRWRTLFFAAGLAMPGSLSMITTSFAQSSASCRAYAGDYAQRYSAGSAWDHFRIGGRRGAARAMDAERRRRLEKSTVLENAYARCMRDRWP